MSYPQIVPPAQWTYVSYLFWKKLGRKDTHKPPYVHLESRFRYAFSDNNGIASLLLSRILVCVLTYQQSLSLVTAIIAPPLYSDRSEGGW